MKRDGLMSDTLDRLKALGSKLDKKLSEKKKRSLRSDQPSSVGSEEKNDLSAVSTEKQAAPTGKKPSRPPRQSAAPARESGTDTPDKQGEEARRLGQILLRHLGIDGNVEPIRAQNLQRLSELFLLLEIGKKVENIEDLFIYKAMNISGIGLKEEDFGEIREGKYVQVIAITYEPDKNGKKKAKNISLGYFGKAESLDPARKNQVIEFVLRWRYEKAFQNLEHYRVLLEKVRPKETLF